MTDSKTHIGDVKNVLDAVMRHRKLTSEQVRHEYAADPFYYFRKISDGEGKEFRIDAEAHERLISLACNYLNTCRAISPDAFATIIGRGIATFASKKTVPSKKVIEDMLAAALTEARESFRETTHYIPCATFAKPSHGFAIGPVRFLDAGEFWDEHGGKIKEHSNDAAGEGSLDSEFHRRHSRHMVRGLKAFLGQYHWVAEVQVGPCHESVSKQHADSLVRSALNVLKLMFGGQYTDRLKIAEDPGHLLRSFGLERNADGRFVISARASIIGNAMSDDWRSFLEHHGDLLTMAEDVLHHVSGFDEIPPLCERFMAALSWYGDAVSETAVGARIIKYVSAIEAIVGTGKEKNGDGKVTKIVVTRAAMLYSGITSMTFADAEEKMDAIYDIRSRLVHGSITPSDPSLAAHAVDVSGVSRMVLLASLEYFTSLGIEKKEYDRNGMRKAYLELEKKEFSPKSPGQEGEDAESGTG